MAQCSRDPLGIAFKAFLFKGLGLGLAFKSQTRLPLRSCAKIKLTFMQLAAGLASAGAHSPSWSHKRKSPQLALWAFLFLVRLAGIEPTTPWFVAKYSIQLSYSRIMKRIIASF